MVSSIIYYSFSSVTHINNIGRAGRKFIYDPTYCNSNGSHMRNQPLTFAVGRLFCLIVGLYCLFSPETPILSFRSLIQYVWYAIFSYLLYRPCSFVKVCMFLYSAVSSPLDRSKRFTLFLPFVIFPFRLLITLTNDTVFSLFPLMHSVNTMV